MVRYCLLLFIYFVSQAPLALAQERRSAIEQLTTDEQVLALVKPFGWEYQELMLGDSARRAYQPYAHTAFRWPGRAWHKADLDGNGTVDLLVMGRRADIPLLFCVLDSGNNRFRVVRNFYSASYERQPNARVVYRHGQALLQYVAFARQRSHRGKLQQRHTRLLTYRWGAFIPYQRRPTTHRIQALTYTAHLYYHGSQHTQVQLAADGKAVVSRQVRAAPDSVAKTSCVQWQLSQTKQQELADLLNYIRFTDCRTQYSEAGLNHRPGCTLTIGYDNGQQKTIDDPDAHGSPGLEHVYHYLEALDRVR